MATAVDFEYEWTANSSKYPQHWCKIVDRFIEDMVPGNEFSNLIRRRNQDRVATLFSCTEVSDGLIVRVRDRLVQ